METVRNPATLVLARELRGLTQAQLAQRTGLPQATISKVENGVQYANDAIVSRYVVGLDLPATFFDQVFDRRALPMHFWRKKARVTATQGRTVEARMNVLRMQIGTLTRAVEVPPNLVPTLDRRSFRGTAEDGARLVRERWLIPRGPIANMTKLLEDHGVVVIPCDFGTDDIDAMSVLAPADTLPPVVLVNPTCPGDRLRWSLAHELGHLVLHADHNYVPTDDTESEADAFASEFSMPAADIRRHLDSLTLDRAAMLKLTWRMSMASIIKRASTLGLMTDRWARSLWMQMSQRGWRMTEPNPVQREEPTLIGEILAFHRRDLGYDDQQLAAALNLFVPEMRAVFLRETPGPALRRIK